MLTTSLTLNYLGVAMPQSAPATNTITGTAPGQTLSGKKGVNNEIISDGGGSTLIGGGGSDTFVVEDPDDAVVVAAGSGVDTIDSDAAYYQLAANVQNLVLSYAGGVGVGNNLDNLLVAEGASTYTLVAGTGNDVFIGNGSGSALDTGGSTTFVIQQGDGNDVISNFVNGVDQVRLIGYADLTSFSEIAAAMTQVGADVELNLGGGETLIFRNETVGAFSASDFQLQANAPIVTFATSNAGVLPGLPNLSNMTLRFSDNFSSFVSSANGSVGWMTQYPWDGRTISNNNEAEYYSDSSVGVNPFSVANGILTITAAPGPNPPGLPYDSGILTSYGSFSAEYGLFEVTAKLPSGAGLWPAIWLLPITQSWPPEIDIMEGLQNNPNAIYVGTHSAVGGPNVGTTTEENVSNTTTSFNTYAVDWEPNTITWYYDGQAIFSEATPGDMHQPMYLLMNLAVGGPGSWPGTPTSAAEFPAQMQISAVQFYASSNTTAVSGSAVLSPTAGVDVASVTPSQTSGTLVAGETITFVVNLSASVVVTGTPTLTLNDGGAATYVGGSGSPELVFTYTVSSGNTAVSALAINAVSLAGGASIKDSGGNAANLAGAVSSFSGLAVNPVTTPMLSPTAAAHSATTDENQALTINVLANATDPGGTLNPSAVAVSAAAAHGTASINTSTGAITYTPVAGYSGTDTFQYTVADVSGVRSAPATITVTVDAPPTTATDNATTGENLAVIIAVLSNDSDAVGSINPASVAVSAAAAHGTTSVNPTTGGITYTPAAGYSGTDTFQYTVANTLGGVSAPATVTVTVTAPAQVPPTAVANSATTEAGQPATIAVLANDSDPGGTLNPASVLVSTGAGHGTASVNTSTGAITYTPTAGFAGTDSFQYTVADISGVRSAPATVTVTVDAPPTTAPDSAATVENQAVSIAVLSKDSDSVGTINPASVTVSSGAAHGTTAVNSSTGAITYTPAAGFTGTDSFQYTVANTLGGVSAPATVTVTVAAPSTGGAPTTAADSGTTEQNQALSIAVLANDSDPGGTINPGSVAVSSGAAHGTTTVNASTGAITYTPTAGFTGTDSFQYTVANTLGSTSAPATVSVTVDAPPKAAADSAVTAENQPVTIAVLGNDSDPLGTINPGSVAVSSGAAHGTASVNASTGAITYTPTTGFTGTDTFQYTVANTQGGVSAPATVIVQVNAPSSGGGSPPPPPGTGFTDGSAGAPAGTPQLPTLLSGYAVRPPWEVAGVDYAVGVQVPAGAALLDPSAIAMTGVAVNTTNHTVTVTGNNVTLNGIDFGRDNGWQVIVKGANDTIENSRFMVGSNQGSNGNVLDVTASASNFSLLGNEINGNNVAVTAQQGQTVSIDSSGTLTIQYNYLHNSGGDMIDLGASNGPQTDIIQYNLFANIGVNTAHADTIQWYNTTTGAGSDIGFNTVYENVNQPGAGNGGLVPLAEGPNATMAGLMLNNNTIIQTAADTDANFSLGFYADMGGTAANVTIHDNYVDPTGPLGYTGSPWFPTGFYGANLATQTVESNTVDMVTGAVISVPSAAAKTEQGYYTYADASGNAPALSDVISVTPSLPAGSQINPGDTVTFTLHLDEAFTVSGTPTLALNDGGTATYVGGSGSSALTFSYTVGNSDVTLPSLAITGVNLPGGATVKDSVGNAANLAGAVGSFAIAVDPPNSPPPPATQLPNLFAGDATRPSWQVAGVDYAVGVPASTALKTPAGIVMKGVSVNATTHVINVTGNGVTLNGYDFSLNGGWRVNVTGKNDTIENSNFAVGANQQIPITAGASATNLSVLYNTIDGGGASANPSAITALISDTGTGLKVEYNWLKNAPQTVIAVRGGTLLDEFNLVQNVGFGAGSAESDLTFSGGVSNNSVISFNTIYNPPHADEPTNLASGLQIEAQNTATLSNTEVENNTIISPGPTPTNSYLIAIHQDAGSNIVNGVNVQDNYLDSTGATAAYFPSTAATNVAFVGNTNLKTGGVVPGIPGTASSNVVGVSAGGGTATPGTKVTITVTMNEAMTVSGKPTLSLNDGGTATYSGGSGTNTLTFTSTISTGNVAVPALAITGVNLPAGSIIVDAAGDAANLSGITQALSGAPVVSTAAVPAGASAPITATSSALVAPAGSSSGSSTGSSSGSSSGAVLGVSSNALAFIAPPAGTDTAAAGSAMPDWLSVAAGDAGSGNPVHLLGGWQPGVPLPGDHATDGGIPASTGATWTTLPMFATIGTATEHAQG